MLLPIAWGETAVVMGEILEQIADHRSISITYNSVSPGAMRGAKLYAQPNHHVDRAMLFPTFGSLYPYLLGKHQAGRRVGFFLSHSWASSGTLCPSSPSLRTSV